MVWPGSTCKIGASKGAAGARPSGSSTGCLLTPKAIRPKLASAAEAAYLEAPNADKEVGEALLGIGLHHWRTENYEEALRVSKMLLDRGFEDKVVYLTAGWSAFCTNDFELAGKYLDMSSRAGSHYSLFKL